MRYEGKRWHNNHTCDCTGDAAYQRALKLAQEILPNGPIGVKMAKNAITKVKIMIDWYNSKRIMGSIKGTSYILWNLMSSMNIFLLL